MKARAAAWVILSAVFWTAAALLCLARILFHP